MAVEDQAGELGPARSSSSSKPTSPGPSTTGAASYVYPIRSLLPREIQPATDQGQTPMMLRAKGRATSEEMLSHASSPLTTPPATAVSESEKSLAAYDDGVLSLLKAAISMSGDRSTRSDQGGIQSTSGSSVTATGESSVPMSPAVTGPSEEKVASGTFAAAQSAAAMLSQIATSAGLLSTSSSSNRPASTSGATSPEPDYFTAVSEPSDGGFEEGEEGSGPASGAESQPAGAISNISQTGIVHLGPTPESPSRDASPRPEDGVDFSDDPAWAESAREAAEARDEPEEDKLVVAYRFEHLETTGGHHIVTGREGRLTKCDDEVCQHSKVSRRLSIIPPFCSRFVRPERCRHSVC
jgi:hypothetical protein